MLTRNLLLFIVSLIYIAIIVLTVLNVQNTSIVFFGHTITLPLNIVLLASAVLSSSASFIFIYCFQKGSVKEIQKLNQWQTQDVKLAAQVKSEREKQLEAKITTLEAALKSALKK